MFGVGGKMLKLARPRFNTSSIVHHLTPVSERQLIPCSTQLTLFSELHDQIRIQENVQCIAHTRRTDSKA
jgi:cobalamin biosynthesis protein CbiD